MAKAARRRKGKPYLSHGSEGMVELGERLVPDPMEPSASIKATVNVRESSIDHMASRGRINASQAEAGQRFRKLWEKAAVGRNKAMDTSREPVDGGGVGDPISDDLVRASYELNKVLRIAGQAGAQLLIAIVGEGRRIEEVAARWSRSGGVVKGDRAQGYVTGRMVEALDELVRFWKLEAAPIAANEFGYYLRNGKAVLVEDDIRVSKEGHTGPAVEVSVGRFGDIVESSQRPLDRAALTPHTSGNIR
jgi:hypothetical protein